MNKGDVFAGNLTILSLAGAGGTANVYKAFDDECQCVVALKVFENSTLDPNVAAELWNREVKALESLQHPAIARMLRPGRDPQSNARFIVLEWIDGISLEEHLEKAGKLTWETFYQSIGTHLLGGLVFAAERNIWHRDLSTSNVIVSTSAAVKIIDFGQARISSIPIGRTVAGWRTAPYCPPEEDTGTYTYTRDPFSFCAIATRALIGYALKDHESLYAAFSEAAFPREIRSIFNKALHRDPKVRFPNSIEFAAALENGGQKAANEANIAELVVPLRILSGLEDRIQVSDADDNAGPATEFVFRELNDTVAVSPARSHESQQLGTRIDLETQSFRMTADIDTARSDHLVIVHLVHKRFRLDSLYQGDKWIPQARFTPELPQRSDQRASARAALQALYRGLEDSQASVAAARRRAGSASIAEWTRLLDALRYIARHEVPPLRYSKLENEGPWLTATVENPQDASEEEIRTISVAGRWVFRGEIDSIVGNQCLLVSTRPRIDLDSIPGRGSLEIDWQQTKVALDRQARAVDRFAAGDLPNPRLGRLLLNQDAGPIEPSFALIPSFFDATLDAPKKEIVSRCISGIDLLVTHGPPGTGKTKLIVELVRQALRVTPTAKILLVSQTHAALDNALERLLKFDPDVSCVRIGSGSKEIDPRVEKCTIENRGRALRAQVEAASRKFLEERAKELGVDRTEVELGLRALDVLALRAAIAADRRRIAELEEDVSRLTREGKDEGTTERSSRQLRSRAIEDSLDRLKTQVQVSEAELSVATQRLADLGQQGKDLAECEEGELRQWAGVLMDGERRRGLADLMKLAEEWRLRFGQSDDFTTAIIASSSIVAGTCVGFCREQAASKTTFDLCIIDEAGKATTTELLVPLAQSRRAVIVGDHHQLPAVIDYAIQSREVKERFGLTDEQIQIQLFEALTTSLALACRSALTVQYRMRGAIGSLISACFYDGSLETEESTKHRQAVDLSLAGLNSAVTWIDPYVGSGDARFEQQVGTSYASQREVQCVVSLLRRVVFVLRHSLPASPWPTVGVITGYAPQANQLRAEIRRDAELDRLNVECATVHAFQGREVDLCVYSVARRNQDYKIGMLSDWRHLNVALSRARDFLVIVGDIEFCRKVPAPNPFLRIVGFIESSSACDIKEWSDD